MVWFDVSSPIELSSFSGWISNLVWLDVMDVFTLVVEIPSGGGYFPDGGVWCMLLLR